MQTSSWSAAAGLIAAALGACAPVLTHGPRVEPGLFVGSTAGILLSQDTAAAPDVLTPDWAPYVRYGLTGEPGDVAGSLAVTLDASSASSLAADLYVQLPSRALGWAYGGGVAASALYVMPYLQLGQSFGRGFEVYTTQAYVHRGDFTDKRGGLDGSAVEVRPRYWAPTLAIRRRDGALGASLQLTGALGRFDERPFDGGAQSPVKSRALRGMNTSLAADVDIGRLLRDLAAITRRPVPRPAPPWP